MRKEVYLIGKLIDFSKENYLTFYINTQECKRNNQGIDFYFERGNAFANYHCGYDEIDTIPIDFVLDHICKYVAFEIGL